VFADSFVSKVASTASEHHTWPGHFGQFARNTRNISADGSYGLMESRSSHLQIDGSFSMKRAQGFFLTYSARHFGGQYKPPPEVTVALEIEFMSKPQSRRADWASIPLEGGQNTLDNLVAFSTGGGLPKCRSPHVNKKSRVRFLKNVLWYVTLPPGEGY
jgi:hypothetical protein